MDELDRMWKVGELARATGLTTRALHHYDDIGLLVPGRTQSGHRVYSHADVERLYQVLALRSVGMALDEIKTLLDDDSVGLIDTVRRHAAAVERDIEQRRRLLDRLRDMLAALERSSAPSVDELIGAVEAMTVVEATIEDVLTRERWEAAWEFHEPYVVVLKESDGERLVPIWIGEAEANALDLQRRGATLPRPLGHDLMAALLGAVDARVERVVIERLQDLTYFATVIVASGGDQREIDARPSDALNLAVRAGAPIQISSDVIEASGLTAWPGPQEPSLGGSDPPPWTPVGEQRRHTRAPTYTIDEHSPAILRLAAAQARTLGHNVVEPAHLLLGILADTHEPAAQLLGRHGITLARTREAAAALAENTLDPPSPDDTMGLSARATFTMHRAYLQARRRGTPDIAPMHLALALLDSPGAAELPGLATIALATVRDDVLTALEA